MAILSASHATAHRWLHSLPPRAPGEAPRATRWWMCWSVGTEWPPAAASALPLLLSCRVRKLVAHRASRYLGWSSRQAPLAGALLPCRSAWRVAASSLECLGWPSRQAPLAGALSPELKYFVLEWLQGNHGGSWRSPDKPCRGVLQLPVHKFGVLGYPYSSTPTFNLSRFFGFTLLSKKQLSFTSSLPLPFLSGAILDLGTRSSCSGGVL